MSSMKQRLRNGSTYEENLATVKAMFAKAKKPGPFSAAIGASTRDGIVAASNSLSSHETSALLTYLDAIAALAAADHANGSAWAAAADALRGEDTRKLLLERLAESAPCSVKAKAAGRRRGEL